MSMFDQPQNEWEKTNALDFVYSKLDLNQLTIATQFYERIKDKPLKILERYHQIIRTRGFCDTISYGFDKKRQARRTALFKVRIEKNMERERKELEEILDYMREDDLGGSISGGFRYHIQF